VAGERAKVGADLVNTTKGDNQHTLAGKDKNEGTTDVVPRIKISIPTASKMVGCSVIAIERELANRNPNSRRKEKVAKERAKAAPAKPKAAKREAAELNELSSFPRASPVCHISLYQWRL
jgi:hypothetical protein